MEMEKRNTNPLPENGEDSDQNDEEEPQKLIKDFGSYTTLHGLHFLCDSNLRVRRILWLLLMLVSLVILSIQIKENYAKLQRHDSMVTKDVEYSRRLRFPAISICNQNMLRRSKIFGTDAQLYLDDIDFLKPAPSRKSNASFDIEKTAREAGHNLTTMMKLCRWRGQKCGAENFTTFVSFYRGLCYTFNPGAPGYPLLDVTSSGTSQALSLIIDVQPKEYYGPFSYEGTGLKVLIHEQSEFPEINIENLGMDVTPGYNTNIRIHRSKTLYLEPPFKPPCGTRKLVTTETYSTSTCFMECFKKHLMDVCNCRFLGLPVGEQFNVTNYCTTKELRECFLPTTAKLNPSVCDCPVQCEKIKFDLQLSSAYFPSPHFWDTVYELLNESDKTDNLTKSDTQEIIRKRLLKVNIFYDSLSTEVTLEKPAYDLSDFASDLGGNMGLFMGCSILTLCEFLDLLIMALVSYYSSRKRGSQKITDHESVANHNSV